MENEGKVWLTSKQVWVSPDGRIEDIHGKMLKPFVEKGRMKVRLPPDGRKQLRHLMVAMLVAAAFANGQKPKGYVDGNFRNCHISNLKFVKPQDVGVNSVKVPAGTIEMLGLRYDEMRAGYERQIKELQAEVERLKLLL